MPAPARQRRTVLAHHARDLGAANARTITRDGDYLVVSYPVAWDKSFAWRHLLANLPAGMRQPRLRGNCQPWAKAHTADAWVWRTSAADESPSVNDPVPVDRSAALLDKWGPPPTASPPYIPPRLKKNRGKTPTNPMIGSEAALAGKRMAEAALAGKRMADVDQ